MVRRTRTRSAFGRAVVGRALAGRAASPRGGLGRAVRRRKAFRFRNI
ncbi:hypothetical protein CHAN_09390 [Corynebacterium hansenii]|nr:hypothetical protein CHAN_09390 [Corynebacterium hansenii]